MRNNEVNKYLKRNCKFDRLKIPRKKNSAKKIKNALTGQELSRHISRFSSHCLFSRIFYPWLSSVLEENEMKKNVHLIYLIIIFFCLQIIFDVRKQFIQWLTKRHTR